MNAPGGAGGSRRGGRRRAGWRAWLAAALLVVPVLEIAVVIQVGRVIGTWPTVLLLVAESLVGAWLLTREGPGAWQRLRAALGAGRVPTNELLDGALILVGGALLLTPGFLTDAVGFAAVLPPTRPLVRGLVRRAIGTRAAAWRPGPPGTDRPRPPRPDVVPGEVLRDDRDPPPHDPPPRDDAS